MGGKTKVLSWRIRKQQERNTVYKIRNSKKQNICTKLEDIPQAFELYYKDLYTQPATVDTITMESFFKDLPSAGEQQNVQ